MWAQEFGMNFNAAKSELIQLAGKIPKRRPVVSLNGELIPWVKEIKYLGVEIKEGRRKRHAAPSARMWEAYHCIKRALSCTLPIPIRNQLLLMQSNILSVALYPSAVVKMDYKSIDRFINRILCRVVGCPQRWTSATFLRAELGVPPARFAADVRALTYYWHLRRETWFSELLPKLRGSAPLDRLEELAQKYDVKVEDTSDTTYADWKGHVKKQVMKAAEEHVTKALAERGYPVEAEAQMKMKKYVSLGGDQARAGIRFRWECFRRSDERFAAQNVTVPCTKCMEQHDARPATGFEDLMLDCETSIPPKHRRARAEAIRAVLMEIAGVDWQDGEVLPPWSWPHLKSAFQELAWPNQTRDSLKLVLDFLTRLDKSWKRLRKVEGNAPPEAAAAETLAT